MKLASSNDQPIKVNRWGTVCFAEQLINRKIGEALCGLTVFCALILPLSGASPTISTEISPSEWHSLDERAEVYVDRYFPPDKRLTLFEAGNLRGKALAHYSRALAYEKAKNADAALREYQQVLRLVPRNIDLAKRVAYLFASSGQIKEGRAVLESSLQINPEQAVAYLNVSKYLLTYQAGSSEAKERALNLATEAVEKFAGDARVYDHLVRFYLATRQTELAKAAIHGALKQSVDDPAFWLKIATIAQQVWPMNTSKGSKPVLLNEIYRKVLDHAKGAVAIEEAVAGFYHSSHQPSKARDLYKKIIEQHPDLLGVRKKLASVYQILGEDKKVIETLREVIQIDSRDAQTNRLLAEIYRSRKDPVNAAIYLQQALNISKGSESEYLDLAQLLLSSRRPEEAVPVLERAAYYFPDEPYVAFLLAVSRSRSKQYKQSLSAFERAVVLAKETRPGLLNEQFYFQYAAASERSGDLDQAAVLFRKSMELLAKTGAQDKESKAFTAQVYNYLGYMWLENDMNIDEAGELIKTAHNLTPESGAIRDSLGWFHYKKKRYEEAQIELSKALELMEEPDPTVHDHLARTYFELGKTDEALLHMRKALNLDSSNQDYVKRLQKFEADKNVSQKISEMPGSDEKKKAPANPK